MQTETNTIAPAENRTKRADLAHLDLLTVEEVQKLLKASRTTVFQMLREGTLTRRKVGKRTRITRTSVEQFVMGAK